MDIEKDTIPKTFRGMSLCGIYPDFAMYIDTKTRIRECFKYDDLRPRIFIKKETENRTDYFKKRKL